jgi:hypothetical protein
MDIRIVSAGIGICVFVVVALTLYFYRYCEKLALRTLNRQYAGITIREVPVAGDVVLSYHTYHGFLAWFTQTEHRMALPADDARILLGRLLRYNLIWSIPTACLFVPPLAIGNYLAQRSSIARQTVDASFRSLTCQDLENKPANMNS